jgi:membrane protease YdiL (CAAX protease family)
MSSTPDPSGRLQALHGGLLLALLPLPALIVALRPWPFYLLVPLLAYGAIVCLVPPLRRSVRWLRVGRFDGVVLAATAGLILATSATLLLWDWLFRPDVRELSEQLSAQNTMPVLLFGALFAVGNALLEEIIWRGVFLEALASQVGMAAALLVQAALFGVAHRHGYPSGAGGAVLAGLYGLLLGLLRQRSGGLAAPTFAHVFADATIFLIVTGLVR